jgi:hypothetical protein
MLIADRLGLGGQARVALAAAGDSAARVESYRLALSTRQAESSQGTRSHVDTLPLQCLGLAARDSVRVYWRHRGCMWMSSRTPGPGAVGPQGRGRGSAAGTARNGKQACTSGRRSRQGGGKGCTRATQRGEETRPGPCPQSCQRAQGARNRYAWARRPAAAAPAAGRGARPGARFSVRRPQGMTAVVRYSVRC